VYLLWNLSANGIFFQRTAETERAQRWSIRRCMSTGRLGVHFLLRIAIYFSLTIIHILASKRAKILLIPATRDVIVAGNTNPNRLIAKEKPPKYIPVPKPAHFGGINSKA
jgi:hypothetical protein